MMNGEPDNAIATPTATPPPAAAPNPFPPAGGSTEDLENKGLASHENAAPAVSVINAPDVVKPQKRGGLAGVMDEIADTIAGTKGAGKVYEDADGNQYIQHPTLSRKGQWIKIAGEALVGAAAGAKAGQGPGGKFRGAAAGIEAADKLHEQQNTEDQQLTQEVRQANQDKANQQLLKMNMARQEFELGRMKVDATQHDVEFAQREEDRMQKLVNEGKGFDLGTYSDEANLAEVQKVHPEFWKAFHAGDISGIPVIGPNGERKGIHVFLTTPGVGNEPQEGQKFHVFTPPTKPGDKPTLTVQTASGPMSPNQAHAADLAAYGQMQKWQIDQSTEEVKKSETARNYSDVAKNKREAERDTENSDLVKDIVSGRIAPATLGRSIASKQGQALLEAVAKADPNIDTSKLAAYPKVYDDFTHGQTSVALNKGATALKHLRELKQLNTLTSRVPGTSDSKAFNNKLDTLVPELIGFYKMPDTDETVRSLKSTLGGYVNRDAAITSQVRSMGDKLDSYHQQWRNAAPSAQYQAPMPNIDDEAKLARAELDPKYANRLFSVSKWQAANPQGDIAAAQKAAEQQGLDVVK